MTIFPTTTKTSVILIYSKNPCKTNLKKKGKFYEFKNSNSKTGHPISTNSSTENLDQNI